MVVDGRTIVSQVPVSYLLFLEKQLTDIHTFVAKLPVLDPSVNWTFNDAAGYYAADAVQKPTPTNKVPRNHVLAEATEKHPAQVQVYYEDVTVGTWTTVKFSGALPATEVRAILDRVTKLREAVKMAREEANGTEVADQHLATAILGHLFG